MKNLFKTILGIKKRTLKAGDFCKIETEEQLREIESLDGTGFKFNFFENFSNKMYYSGNLLVTYFKGESRELSIRKFKKRALNTFKK